MVLSRPEGGQGFGIGEEPDGPGRSRRATDEPALFESEDHLMDEGRRHAEVALQVGFGRWPAEHDRVGVDEGEILPLLVNRRSRRTPSKKAKLL